MQKRRKHCVLGDVRPSAPTCTNLVADRDDTSKKESAHHHHPLSNLQACNEIIEQRLPSFDAKAVWTEWMWNSDPHEQCTVHFSLNRNQLLGLLLAKHRAYGGRGVQQASGMTVRSILTASGTPHMAASMLGVVDAPIQEYSLRNLRDAVQNLQV